MRAGIIKFSIIFLACVSLAFGQTQKSKGSKLLWSPPDKSFTVIVPVRLKNTKEYDEGSDSAEYTSIKTYSGATSDDIFLLLVLELGKDKKNKTIEEKFGGLQFVIGGDDDSNFAERYTKIDDLNAKEIIYSNQNSKGLMIDSGSYIYILGLRTKNRKDLDSDTANRFFTSFHLLQKNKMKSKIK